jgi:hypothetical protein
VAKEIIHPVGGLNRQFGFQRQAPFTTAYAQNVRSVGSTTGRARGGSRPGLGRAFVDQLGSDPITGTIGGSPVYDSEAGTSVVNSVSAAFAPWMIGHSIDCTVSGVSYRISAYQDDTSVTVDGDASAETDAAFTIAYGKPINCLGYIRPAQGTEAMSLRDTFEGRTPDTPIKTAPWVAGAIPGLASTAYLSVREVSGKRYAVGGTWVGGGWYAGNNLAAAVAMDLAKPYSFSVKLAPHNGVHGHGFVTIYLRMHDSSPTSDDSVSISMESPPSYSPGGWLVVLARNRGGASLPGEVAAKDIYLPTAYTKELRVTVSGDTVTAYFDGALVGTITDATPPGSRFGMAIRTDQPLTGPVPLVDEFRLDYSSPSVSLDYGKPKLYSAANGILYVENDAGGLDAVTSSADITADRLIDAVELGGSVFIADYGVDKYIETGCTIDIDGTGGSTGAGRVLDKADVDWSDADPDNDICLIEDSGTNGPPVGAFGIASIGTGGIHAVLASTMNTYNASGVGVRIARAPKVYNPVTNTLSIWNQTIDGGIPAGAMPLGCPLIARYRGRIVLGGAASAPHVWYMSRIGDAYDWDYSKDADDTARAIAGSSTDYGIIAEPLTALISYSDDYMIFGCKSQMWVLRGDPGDNGYMDNISYEVGIVGQRAWCHTPGGEIVFLSTNGLFALSAGAQGKPVALSRETLPRELIGVDTSLFHPMLVWDEKQNGVHVFLTPKTQDKIARSTAAHYFYDWEFKAFWPVVLWGAHEPWSVCSYELSGTGGRHVLLGGHDGYIRKFSFDSGSDDGASLQSSVLIGPFRGDAEYDMLLAELTGILGTSSGNVTWAVYGGDSAEEAYDRFLSGTSLETGTWTAGRNRICRPRRRGNAFYLQLSSNGTTGWEWDSAIVSYKVAGRTR